MRKNLPLLFIFSISCCFGQVRFQKTYGGSGISHAKSVQQTLDGGYIIAGDCNSFGAGSLDVYLVKTDSAGNVIWTKTYGGTDQDYAYFVQQTSDSGYIIVGNTWSFGEGNGDIYLIKTNVNGDTLWTKTFGGIWRDMGFCVRQTSDGGYVIAGYTESFGLGASDAYLIKTDSNGNSIWTKIIGGGNQDYVISVQQTTDGGLIFVGTTSSFGPGPEAAYLIKTTITGDTLWTRTYGGMSNDYGNFVQQIGDGGFIITGVTNSFGARYKDYYLTKTDSAGNPLWTKTYGGLSDEVGMCVKQTTDGGYILTGNTTSFGSGDYQVYVVKTDANGSTTWSKTFGRTDYDAGESVQQTSDGGYIIAGSTNYAGGSNDLYLIKTDVDGNSECNEGNPSTIETSPSTMMFYPVNIISTSNSVETVPLTVLGSGGTEATLCFTTSIQSSFNNPQSEIIISPNPAHDNFTIRFNDQSKMENGELKIFDVMGRVVHEQTLRNNQSSIISTQFSPGVYFVKVSDGEKVYEQKLVVE